MTKVFKIRKWNYYYTETKLPHFDFFIGLDCKFVWECERWLQPKSVFFLSFVLSLLPTSFRRQKLDSNPCTALQRWPRPITVSSARHKTCHSLILKQQRSTKIDHLISKNILISPYFPALALVSLKVMTFAEIEKMFLFQFISPTLSLSRSPTLY